jgi:hypothetical protein
MKEKFFKEFDIVGMSRKSIIAHHRASFRRVYISRAVFNSIMSEVAHDYRIVEDTLANGPIYWLEASIWTRF